MVKIIEDTFEKLVEQGATQTKKAVKSAVQQAASTVSASKMWEQILGVNSVDSNPDQSRTPLRKEQGINKKSHTPLDLDKLNRAYIKTDKQKETDLKNRLFQLVKQGDERVFYEKKQQEVEKKRKEEYDKDLNKKKEESSKKQAQQSEIPKGKVRRSIFSAKKIAERQHSEVKPASGKQ